MDLKRHNMERRRIISIIIVSIVLLIIILSVVYFFTRKDEVQTGSITDRDTGKIAITGHTGYIGESDLVIFGEENLYNNGLTKDQFKNIRTALIQYSIDRLDKDIQSLTVRPQDLKITGDTITSTIRIGQTDELLPIEVKIDTEGGVVVLVSDQDKKHGGPFIGVSGLPYTALGKITVDQPNENITSLSQPVTLYISAPQGYRNGLIEKLKTLGHTPSEFSYIFNDYRNPFE